MLRLCGLGAALAGAGALSGCGFMPQDAAATVEQPTVEPRVDGPLVYFNWAEVADPEVLNGFTAEYGVDVIQSNFDSMESMVAKLAAGNRYDVIFPSDKFAQRLIRAGQLYRLDHQRLPNSADIFDHYAYFADPWYDPKSAHTVPYSMYKTGIGYRKDKLGDQLSGSWADLWDPRADGVKFLLDDRDEVLGLGALRLGYDLNTGDSVQLKEIVRMFQQLRPALRGFSGDTINNMLNESSWLQQMWSGDIVSVVGQAEDPGVFGYQSPKEGAPTGSDNFAIPRNAEHPGTAMLFIDYMLRPENVAANTSYSGYAMPVRSAEEVYAELVADVPEAMVTAEDVARDLNFHNMPQVVNQARDAAYTQIKAG
jgi:spermidine/putrescine transport system substrate-binding protein